MDAIEPAPSGGASQDPPASRTDLAEDRTLLASERTFASWIRTGFAAVGVGIGLNALFRTLEPLWVAKAIATAFALLGIFIFFAAERTSCREQRRLAAHEVSPFRASRMRAIAFTSMLATAALVAALWFLV